MKWKSFLEVPDATESKVSLSSQTGRTKLASSGYLNRRIFLKGLGFEIGAAMIPGCSKLLQSESSAIPLPNIVFVMADDLGYGDLGCYGATKIKTPNIDRIASEGIRFTDAHSPSAVCTPTRYGVLTGRYCWRTRLKSQVLWCGYTRSLIEPGRPTIASMLKSKGYETAQIGKWHLGWEDAEPIDYSKGYLGRGPKHLGFEYSFVTAASHNLYPCCFVENHRLLSRLVPHTKCFYNPENDEIDSRFVERHKKYDLGPMLIAEDWQPDQVDYIYTKKTIEFIERHHTEKPNKPFYVHLTPEAPHLPSNVPDFKKGKSQAGARSDHIMMLDWMVGQINETLDRLRLKDNTLIIVTSDNGPRRVGIDGNENGEYWGSFVDDFGHKSAGILRGFKGDLFEGGHRVPFIARWPGWIPAGSTSEELISLVDMMATFAAITDYKLSANMAEDSYNILPAMLDQKLNKPIREVAVFHDFPGNFAIRKGPWKLLYPDSENEQLYHLGRDLRETNNIAEQHPEIVEELTLLLEKYKKSGLSSTRLG